MIKAAHQGGLEEQMDLVTVVVPVVPQALFQFLVEVEVAAQPHY
jgi:hypothetical protein